MNANREFLQHSLLLKLGGALALIATFAILGMASSGIIAESAQGSGEAINLAGSLRMQTYKMTSLALSARLPEGGDVSAPLRKAIDAFDATLTDARITSVMSDQVETDLANSYVTVQQAWQRMKPRLLEEASSSRPTGPDSAPLFQEVALFVWRHLPMLRSLRRILCLKYFRITRFQPGAPALIAYPALAARHANTSPAGFDTDFYAVGIEILDVKNVWNRSH